MTDVRGQVNAPGQPYQVDEKATQKWAGTAVQVVLIPPDQSDETTKPSLSGSDPVSVPDPAPLGACSEMPRQNIEKPFPQTCWTSSVGFLDYQAPSISLWT